MPEDKDSRQFVFPVSHENGAAWRDAINGGKQLIRIRNLNHFTSGVLPDGHLCLSRKKTGRQHCDGKCQSSKCSGSVSVDYAAMKTRVHVYAQSP